jgi:hypothetical protein
LSCGAPIKQRRPPLLPEGNHRVYWDQELKIKFSSFVKLPVRQPNPIRVRGHKKKQGFDARASGEGGASAVLGATCAQTACLIGSKIGTGMWCFRYGARERLSAGLIAEGEQNIAAPDRRGAVVQINHQSAFGPIA